MSEFTVDNEIGKAKPARKAMVILNPSSGKERAAEYARDIEDVLRAKGYDVELRETAGEQDATRFCRSACGMRCDLVVSAGGDGTLNETINGLLSQEHRPQLGIVPLGTVNDFARALGLPLDPQAAIAALASSRVRAVDLGRINDRLFTNVVAAGNIAEAVAAVSSEEKSRLGSLAYLKEGLKELVSQKAYPMRIEYDGEVWEGESPLFVAALTNSVAGFEKMVPDAAVDDGLIHGFIFKDIGWLGTLTAGWSLWAGSLREHKDVVAFTARQVSVRSFERVRTNVDGEEGPDLPLELQLLPGHVEVVVPEDDR
ncbi:Transcription regulator [contains diacylglycerol kinase catalytic domain] [Paenibacillus pasadenensis]|uniref:Transcription regulator [contains diacylglycerol kinase catalytic domain] n=1 Tax=Paenibacillus pasadenensis TaxID=217090 RepID=A0A2N5NCR6_9BACL|nr:diacylglycerol kinase family protein [Paenibacillus pasadenensis]PLT48135.1 Transcription regulator [contains diacylglycerol kinase catalytic domain] [Paenibacillus pasadenensis]